MRFAAATVPHRPNPSPIEREGLTTTGSCHQRQPLHCDHVVHDSAAGASGLSSTLDDPSFKNHQVIPSVLLLEVLKNPTVVPEPI